MTLNFFYPNSKSCSQNSSNDLLFKSLLTITILKMQKKKNLHGEVLSYQIEAQVRKTLVYKGTVETGFNTLNTT